MPSNSIHQPDYVTLGILIRIPPHCVRHLSSSLKIMKGECCIKTYYHQDRVISNVDFATGLTEENALADLDTDITAEVSRLFHALSCLQGNGFLSRCAHTKLHSNGRQRLQTTPPWGAAHPEDPVASIPIVVVGDANRGCW